MFHIWVYKPLAPKEAWMVECPTMALLNIMKMHYSDHPTLCWSYRHPCDKEAL